MTALSRFLRYVALPTMSDEASGGCPSTEKQRALAELLAGELRSLGISDAECDKNGYVYASIPATAPLLPAIGLIAHMDTSPDAPDSPVNARVVGYDGTPVLLNEDGDTLSEEEYPSLAAYRGQHIVVTDGKTLLGGDDKAGIAAIMTAAERLCAEKPKHGKICICFTPDEEIGRGADLFDLKKFGADFAYTVDGGKIGELEYENFNASSAFVEITGRSIHPGSAKGKLRNASLLAMEFDSLLPPDELPSKTEGREGFHHLCGMEGDVEHARLGYLLRDFDPEILARRKNDFEKAAARMNGKYAPDTVKVTVTDSYFNMAQVMREHPDVIERAKNALLSCGITPCIQPIRGGTDGARLSFMGLPCPNLGTGDENPHSRFEYVSAEGLEKNVDVLLALVCG